MTPPPALPPADDELASRIVDGDATAAERARLELEPALAARVEELRRVRAVVAGPVEAVDEPRRERAVAAALAVADQGNVVPLAPRRRRGTWLPAAAAATVAVLVGAGAFAALRDRDTVSNTETATVTAADDASGGDDSGGSEFDRQTAGGGATTTAAAPTSAASGATTTIAGGAATPAPLQGGDGSLPDLGALDAPDALRTAVQSLPPPSRIASAPEAAATSCGDQALASAVATVTWRGEPALVVWEPGPPARAVVVHVTTCQPLAEVPLD